MANARTLLAYLPSPAALVIAGASIVHFSTQDWFWSIGILCIPIGIVTGILGAVRYRRRKISISAVRKHLEAEPLKPRGKDS